MENSNSNSSPNTRIERKRAHDREAQRASRAKTKAYIAHLEQTVAELSETSGDNRANYLARHVSKQAQELEAMQALVQKIRTLVQEAPRSETDLQGIADDDDEPDGPGVDVPTQALITDKPSTSEASQFTENPQPVRLTNCGSYPLGTIRPMPKKLAEFGDSLVCDENDPHYFQRIDNALRYVEQTADHLSGLEEDEDIIIRAIVDGWDAAAKMHHLDVAWRLFREADETLWCRIRPIDRLAHFWQMRSTMLNKVQPKNQERRDTPSFMSPTYVQRTNVNHPVVADYFAWPHVRDNLINTGVTHVSGRQTIAFAESFRFIWPYEMRDMYKKNTSTGFYSFSEGFMRNFNNLACYRILESGDATTDIPVRMNPQLSWKSAERVIECKSPDEPQSDSSPEVHAVNEPILIPQPPVMPSDTPPDWLPPIGMDIMNDPRFLNFMDPLNMSHEGSVSWSDMCNPST